jgi:hypothetical protein
MKAVQSWKQHTQSQAVTTMPDSEQPLLMHWIKQSDYRNMIL